jgi:hypothetical protein
MVNSCRKVLCVCVCVRARACVHVHTVTHSLSKCELGSYEPLSVIGVKGEEKREMWLLRKKTETDRCNDGRQGKAFWGLLVVFWLLDTVPSGSKALLLCWHHDMCSCLYIEHPLPVSFSTTTLNWTVLYYLQPKISYNLINRNSPSLGCLMKT